MAKYIYNKKKNSTHQLILEEIAPCQVVLDVGCGPGYLGEELCKKGCKVFGIEIDTGFISEATPHYEQIVQCNLDSPKDLPFTKESFDTILLADIIEHLKYPEDTVRFVLSYLKPGGKVIISVPNIANIMIRCQLLFGRFEYMDAGILDRTHLRFFTLRTIKEFISNVGLCIRKIKYGSDHFDKIIGRVKRLGPLLAYQFIVVGVRNEER